MDTTEGSPETDGVVERVDEDANPAVSAYSTSEDRVVFTESDNDDGWIATDQTVEPRR